MRILRLLLVLPLALCVTGCFSSYTLVKVKADGTGTVEQTTLISPSMVGMMAGMAAGMGGGEPGAKAAKPPTITDMFKEDELKAAATRMGEGVSFVSSTPAKAEGREGVTAIYAFTDITKLSVSQSVKAPGSVSTAKTDSPILFALTPGTMGTKTLTITMPEGKKPTTAGPKPTAKPDGPDLKNMPPEAMAMVKQMFQGAKIGIDVEVDGKLVKTNSPYAVGNKVTLMEVDLGALMEDPARLAKMQEMGKDAGFDQVRAALGDVKGIKIPAARVTTIEFTNK